MARIRLRRRHRPFRCHQIRPRRHPASLYRRFTIDQSVLIITFMNDQPNINQDQPQDPFVDLRTSVSGEQSVLELQRRKDSFTDLGFSDEFVSNLSEKYPKLSTEHNLSVKLKDLTDAGFENPVALIEKFPAILGLSFKENITPKLKDLTDAGFENPVALIEKFPAILGYSFKENITPKLKDLTDAGFENPVALIEKN